MNCRWKKAPPRPTIRIPTRWPSPRMWNWTQALPVHPQSSRGRLPIESMCCYSVNLTEDCCLYHTILFAFCRYTWRIDLAKSEQYWPGWFENLSQKFLDLRVPKLLLLASIDGLDRTLTVGQMQGRFQLQVLARCGHAVQEDRPHEVAEVVASYMIRNKFAEAAGNFVRQMPAC